MGIVGIFAAALLLLVSPYAVCVVGAETLEEAWAAVLKANHIVKSVDYSVRAQGEAVRARRAERFPSIMASAGYTALDNAPSARTTIGGSAIEFQTAEQESAAYTITAMVPLFTSGRIRHAIEAGEASWSAARSRKQSVLQDLKLETATAYVSVLRASRSLEVANSHVSSLESHVRDVEHRYEQGMVPRKDVLAAQVSLADARQERIRVRNGLEIAKVAYNRLLVRPLDQEVTLAEPSLDTVADPPAVLTRRASDRRSEVAALRARIESLRAQAASVRASTLPQIALSGGYDFQENKYQVHEREWFSNVAVRWQLFDAGVARYNTSSLEQRARELQEQLEDLLGTIRVAVRQAWLDVRETRSRLEVTEKALAAADENLRVNRDRYRNGLSTNTEVLDAETLRTRSRYNHTNALYDAILAVLRLKRAVGVL